MTFYLLRDRPVAVIGAGVMGIGIVQVALLAGHPVLLFDKREGAAEAAARQLSQTFATLREKGKLTAAQVDAALTRLRVAPTLAELADAALVVEAIVENLAVKQALLAELEGLVSDGCVLASNTSSLSITALARGLRVPGRVVGMHFFNPVPLMKLVEVVSGLATDGAVAEAAYALARDWGKTPVHAKSTPGFIVNRIARPFYAETLALLQEQAATPAVLDACVRGAGFRMGPCELMDLIGHDTNFAVTHAVYEANFFDKRFQPSLVQREMVDGGLLGRKSGRGFYRYPDDPSRANAATDPAPDAAALAGQRLVLHGTGAIAELLAARLEAAGLSFTRAAATEQTLAGIAGLAAGPGARREPAVALRVGDGLLMPTDGRTAAECAATLGTPDLALFDWPIGPAAAAPGTTPEPCALAHAIAEQATPGFAARAAACLHALGWRPLRLADAPGLVVARTIAMLVNEASDAVEQGVCDEAGADAAMTLGVNYPAGPFAWRAACGVEAIVRLVDALDAQCRGERYRVSPRLRRAAWSAPGAR